jgi:hypothetical protein
MVLLHVAQPSVAIAADENNVVSELPSSDVMEFQATGIVF